MELKGHQEMKLAVSYRVRGTHIAIAADSLQELTIGQLARSATK